MEMFCAVCGWGLGCGGNAYLHVSERWQNCGQSCGCQEGGASDDNRKACCCLIVLVEVRYFKLVVVIHSSSVVMGHASF